ncbi:MAG: translation initiation factor eIF-1A [Candidatus Micrarchaeota archaeon]
MKNRRENPSGVPQEFRVRLPRKQEGEILGKVEALHGGKRMTVKCEDNRMRMCRIPGKLKRLWVRPDDYVIVKPWPIEGNEKGDVIWCYKRVEAEWLDRNGHLKNFK